MNSHLILIFSFGLATFLMGFFIIPTFIELLKEFKLWKQIREQATIWKATEFFRLHKNKVWTPTMWWLIILLIVFFMVFSSILLQYFWFINNSLLNQKETFLPLFTLFTVWFIWLIDDYMNIKWIGRSKWLSVKFKMFWLLFFATIWALWFYMKLWWFDKDLIIPFLGSIDIWMWFIPLFIFIIVAFSNSVNITDGLDWLAWWLLLFSYSIYAYITYDQWLFLLSTLNISIVWALIAFLWFNVKPAQFYMWDVWSLALWANLWIMAMLTNTLGILIVIWLIFILESASVVIQLTSKKFRNWKKIFRIAPFHHHLEAIGWPEENVVFRLWLVWIILWVSGIIFYIMQK